MDYLLDTNAVIYLQQGRLFEPLPVGGYGISVITEMELLSFSGLNETQTVWLKKFIGSVATVPLDGNVKETAIRLRREHRLKLPDAIIVASALTYDARLVTHDQQLVRLPSLRLHSLVLRESKGDE
jgi:predicted nucleic acid-binding protein